MTESKEYRVWILDGMEDIWAIATVSRDGLEQILKLSPLETHPFDEEGFRYNIPRQYIKIEQ